MIDRIVFVVLWVGAVVGVALYGHQNGFGAQCKKMFPESEVKQMICVEKRVNGSTIEQIWEELCQQ